MEKETWLWPVMAVLAATIFFIDISVQPGVAGGLAYILLPLLSLLSSSRRLAIFGALSGSVLTVAGYYYSPHQGGLSSAALTNRFLALFVIWITVVLILRQIRATQDSNQFKTTLDSTPDCVFMFDPESLKLFYVNLGAMDKLDYSRDEFLSMTLLDIKPDFTEKSLRDMLAPLVHGSPPLLTFETTLRRKSGELVPVEVFLQYISPKDGNPRFIAISQDITDRKQAEEQVKLHRRQMVQADKMKSLGVLVSGVAHEINNPNSFIMVNAPLLEKIWTHTMPILEEYNKKNGDFSLGGMPFETVKTAVPRLVTGICDGSDRIKHIVDKLKDFARHDMAAPRRLVNINDIVNSASTLVESLIKESTHNFRIKCAADLPPIWCNYYEVEQVIINLITNACQALPDSDRKVLVQTSSDSTGQNIMVEVIDGGVGIDPEQLDVITDPFYSTKRESGGTGLGLSVSYNIIRDHNGMMEFESKLGEGTTATIHLPVDQRKINDES